jgi:hypothetical protein
VGVMSEQPLGTGLTQETWWFRSASLFLRPPPAL